MFRLAIIIFLSCCTGCSNFLWWSGTRRGPAESTSTIVYTFLQEYDREVSKKIKTEKDYIMNAKKVLTESERGAYEVSGEIDSVMHSIRLSENEKIFPKTKTVGAEKVAVVKQSVLMDEIIKEEKNRYEDYVQHEEKLKELDQMFLSLSAGIKRNRDNFNRILKSSLQLSQDVSDKERMEVIADVAKEAYDAYQKDKKAQELGQQ